MGVADLILGASATEAPLPPVRPLYFRRFTGLVRLGLRSLFRSVELFTDTELDRDDRAPRHLVIYCNHPGFWDPLVALLAVQAFVPGHRLLAPIEKKALSQHWYFRGLGFFGVELGTARGFRQFVEVCQAAFAAEEPTCLVLTPEGHFRDPLQRPLRFMRGLAAVLASAPADVRAYPMALDYRTTDRPRLRALVRLGQAVETSGVDKAGRQAALEGELERLLDRHQACIAEGGRGENLLERKL